jgi:hypothetical protein
MGAKGGESENLIFVTFRCLIRSHGADRTGCTGQVIKHVQVASSCLTCLTTCFVAISTPTFGFIYREWEHKIGFTPFWVGPKCHTSDATRFFPTALGSARLLRRENHLLTFRRWLDRMLHQVCDLRKLTRR